MCIVVTLDITPVRIGPLSPSLIDNQNRTGLCAHVRHINQCRCGNVSFAYIGRLIHPTDDDDEANNDDGPSGNLCVKVQIYTHQRQRQRQIAINAFVTEPPQCKRTASQSSFGQPIGRQQQTRRT